MFNPKKREGIKMPHTPMLITVTGPSGTGKDSVISGVISQDPKLRRFTTATTRPPRPGDIEGVHYFFLSRQEFDLRLEKGEIWEYSDHYNNRYGTWGPAVETLFAEGCDVISDINWRGVAQLQQRPNLRKLKILILPPSRDRLEQRLTKRNPELAPEGLARLKLIESDLLQLHNPNHVFTNPDMAGSRYADYDAVVINDVLDHTVTEVARLIQQARVAL
jgi:guanylate kinase